MACCSRRKPVQEADQEPILNAPQANDDYSYSHTDELTSADTTGMSYVPAANRKKGFADEFRDMYSRLSLSSWWRSKPGQKDGKHAPPSIQVHTPRTSQEKGWNWLEVSEKDTVAEAAAPQGMGAWISNVLPVNFGTEKKPPPAAAPPENGSNAQKKTLLPPPQTTNPDKPSNGTRPHPPRNRPPSTPQKSPISTRRSTAMSPGDPVQGAGKSVKSKISDKELQEVTARIADESTWDGRIGGLKRNGHIDNALEALLYQKVSARDPHLFMAWTVYQCNGDELKFLTALRGLR